MTLVTLCNTVAVRADEVVDVTIPEGTNRVRVTLRNGNIHSIPCRYGASIFTTRDMLVTEINDAMPPFDWKQLRDTIQAAVENAMEEPR